MSIEKLVADHAHWADEIRRLKRAGENKAAQCVHLKAGVAPEEIHMTFGTNCIQRAWDELQKERAADPFERWEYDEIFEDMEPEPCDHCRKVRELRRERMKAIKRLGAVRAAITRVGRRMKQEETAI